MARIFLIILTPLLLTSCGPPFPDDSDHRGAEDPDCIGCHFYGVWDDPDRTPRIPTAPPENHWDGVDPDDRFEDCTDCHEMD